VSVRPARRLCRLIDLPDGEGRAMVLDGVEIAVFRRGDAVRAVGNRCPHAGGPLADGILAGDVVACPLHGRTVDLRTGAVADCDGTVPVLDVAVDAGVVVLHD
jgi:nitrite reductase [NAD(P)H] small subunit